MKKAVFGICMVALVPAAMWGYGVISAGLDAKKGGPQPSVEPAGVVQRVVHKIVRSGYDYYFRNFSKVRSTEDSTAAALDG